MHECMQLMTRDLTQRWRMDRSKDIPWEKVAEIEAATQVLKAFATAIAALTGGPGIELSNAILIPPRMNVRVVTSEGSPLRVYLRGLRSRNVA